MGQNGPEASAQLKTEQNHTEATKLPIAEDLIAKAVDDLLNRLLEANLIDGYNVVVSVYDSFSRSKPPAGGKAKSIPSAACLHGGNIWINTKVLLACCTARQVAWILDHELGHIIVRHGIEQVFMNRMETYVSRLNAFHQVNYSWKPCIWELFATQIAL